MPTEQEFIAKAQERGIDENQARQFFAQRQEEANTPIPQDEAFALEAESRGFTRDQIGAYFREQEQQQPQTATLTSETIERPTFGQRIMSLVSSSLFPEMRSEEDGEVSFGVEQPELVTDYIADAQNLLQVQHPWRELQSLVGNDEAQAYLDKINTELASDVIAMGRDVGLQIEYENGRYFTITENGDRVETTPSLMRDLWGEKFEIAGAMYGGIQGANFGRNIPLRGLPGLGAMALTSGAGAMVGSVAGSQLDYTIAAAEVQEELNAKIAFERGVGAAKASVIYDMIGLSAIKLGSAGYRGLRTVYDHIVSGNRPGAYDSLLHTFNLSPDEAEDVVQRWEALNKMEIEGGVEQRALTILPVTRPGGENIVAASTRVDPRASASIAGEINQRSQTLLRAAGEVTDDDAAARVLTGVRNYESGVKYFYETVKGEFTAGEIPTGFSLNLDTLLDATFKKIESTISIDDAANMQFLAKRLEDVRYSANHIQDPGQLLDLRRQFTQLKYSNSIRDTEALNAIDTVIDEIDNGIKEIAELNMGESEAAEWLSNWDSASQSYSEMLQLRRNVLFRTIVRPGITPNAIAKALVKFGTTVDDKYFTVNTYRQFRDSLAPEVLRDVEGQVVDLLTEKFTIGRAGEFRATDFIALNDALKQYDFLTPEAQRIQIVTERLADVYYNDVKLLRSSGIVNIEQFQSYLTTSPWQRLKYWIASKTFNFAQQVGSGNASDVRAMVNLVAKFLEEPLNSKTTEQLLNEVAGDQEWERAIRDYQAMISREGLEEASSPRVRLYQDNRGRLFTRPVRGTSETDLRVVAHRVMTEDAAKDALGLEELTYSALTPTRKAALVNQGYEAIRLNTGQIIRLVEDLGQ